MFVALIPSLDKRLFGTAEKAVAMLHERRRQSAPGSSHSRGRASRSSPSTSGRAAAQGSRGQLHQTYEGKMPSGEGYLTDLIWQSSIEPGAAPLGGLCLLKKV